MGPIKGLNPEKLRKLKEVFKFSLLKLPQYNQLSVKAIVKNLDAVRNSYKIFSGNAELVKYQDQVTSLQKELMAAQEDRRKIVLELNELHKKLNELQDELLKTHRHDNLQRYLDLLQNETQVLKGERDASERYQKQDQLEQKIFTNYTKAVHDSQEKQSTRIAYSYRYWYLLLALGGVGCLVFYVSTKDLKTELVEEEFHENNKEESWGGRSKTFWTLAGAGLYLLAKFTIGV